MKKSFILYGNYWKQIQLLDFEQCGRLFKAIFAHECGKELPTLDPITQMLFSVISDQLDREREKYEDVSKKRAEAGRKGAAVTNSAYQKKAAIADDNENGNANETVNANENKNKNENEKENEKEKDNAVYEELPPDVSLKTRQQYDRIMKECFGITPSQHSLDQYLKSNRNQDRSS